METKTAMRLVMAADEMLKFLANKPMESQFPNLDEGTREAWAEAARGVNMELRSAVASARKELDLPDRDLFHDIPMDIGSIAP